MMYNNGISHSRGGKLDGQFTWHIPIIKVNKPSAFRK